MQTTMQVIHDAAAMQRHCLELRAQGRRIAFVPTMGYLHEGHLSLLREGRKRGDVLALSIFVNPTQFGANEDLSTYPRDFERDAEMARGEGVDLIFAPTPDSIYPPGYATYVDVEGLTDTLCGANRPGHFRGVATVVTKLFNIVQPQVALFGAKDFQQLAVIRRMTLDLNLPVEILGMPIVREADGLAMSSRNVKLAPEHRRQALALVDALRQASCLYRDGQTDASVLIAAASERIGQEADARIDYIQLCNDLSLKDVARADDNAVMLLAVRFGAVRLIDNHILAHEL